MPATKANIFAQLQKDILSLQGFKPISNNTVDIGLGPINDAFPNGTFPLGVVHEFFCGDAEDATATSGFISGVITTLMQRGGVSLWISSSRTLFPPALKAFGINPEKIVFVDLQNEREVLWVMEEALKCDGLAAVVGEMRELSFIASRRLQLVVEQSRVTGFILRHNLNNLNTTACVTRWKIISLPSTLTDDMPGVGFPRWNVQLLKVRNGTPGNWQINWINGSFRPIYKPNSIIHTPQKKTG